MIFILVIMIGSVADVFGILGGSPIGIEKAPFQLNYGDVCGGVLIDRRWALTTAHCGSELSYIRFGSSERLGGTKIKIIKHKVHPRFREKHGFDYDIQLLKLSISVEFDDRVAPISIGDGGFGANVFVTGWGYVKEQGDYQNTLQEVELPIVDMGKCQEVEQKWYNHTLTGRMFCAGGGNKDACQGDSGGGAVSSNRLIGLSSFGYGCGRTVPGVYTNVSEPRIRRWIRHHTGI